MAHTRFPAFRFSILVLALALSTTAFAANVATMQAAGAQVSWMTASASYESIDLIVSAPDGQIYTKRFTAQQSASFSLSDLGSGMTDGVYNYELRINPKIAANVALRLKAAREAGDDVAARRILNEAGISGNVQSGSFSIRDGALVSSDAVESAGGTRRITTNARPTTPVTNDQVIPDDLIVQGSACVGLDCVNNESFGFDTIRLKENNLRINFTDTSVAPFPTNDWELTANDSASGAASKFSITDITGSKVPFTVTAGAATNSIFVDSTGRVGFRTSTPVLDLHINTSNTPAIRLEQNNSGGFTAQTWDIGANEANFFVRDVTGGSKLSFRIRPGAPTSSIDISSDGDVGIGTASPSEKLHVFENADVNTFVVVENSNAAGTSAAGIVRAKADTAVVNFQAHGTARTVSRFGVTLGAWSELLVATGNGLAMGTVGSVPVILGTNSAERLHLNGSDNNVGISCNNPTSDLVIASAGGCSNPASNINAGSTQFTVTSSRTYKENLEPVEVPDLLEKMEKVGVYKYDFKQGPKDRLGLMAEDFHAIFGRGDEKLLDGGDVQMALWMAVQKLVAENKVLIERLDALEKNQPK